MSAPQLTVSVDGQGTVSADQLNTLEQTCDTVAQLRSFVGIAGIQVFVRGITAPNDGGQGAFYWNAGGTAPDDNGATTVVPYGAGSGEWTRLGPSIYPIPVRFTHSYADPAATTSTTGVMMGLAQAVTPSKSGNFLVVFQGVAANTLSGDGAFVELRYGTGSAPANGAVLTGTLLLSTEMTAAANVQIVPFSISIYLSGLTVGTAYWLDLSVAATTAGTASVAGVSGTVIEL
jgi:hypothetical protein